MQTLTRTRRIVNRNGFLPAPTATEPKLSVVAQVRQSMFRKNRLAMVVGFILGSFVPAASFTVAHYEAPRQPTLWLLVAAGLAYSAMTVFEWAKLAFRHPLKALGFCCLLEGVLIFSLTPGLTYAALALLVTINGIATGCTLALDQRR